MLRSALRLSRNLAVFILIVAVSAAAGLAHYAYRGGDLSELERSAGKVSWPREAKVVEEGKRLAGRLASSLPAVHAEPGSAGEIRVFFAPCQPMNPMGIDDAFFALLDGAQHSIRGAFYEFQLPKAAEILVAKHKAGVSVELVSDSDYQGRDAIRTCIAAGIPVVFDEREAFMHDKFCVVDDTLVWTGSTNATENCMYRNNNNSLLITSPQLAADYRAEFDEMFGAKRFGKSSPSATPYPEVTVGGARIECYFAPEDHVRKAIVRTVAAAQTKIEFLAFSFTSDEIAAAMIDRMAHGVRVRGVFDSRMARSTGSEYDALAKRGAEVFLDQNQYAMHDKVIVVDSETVVTGSYNFTQSAETKNDENVLIIHSPAVADQYRREFDTLVPR